MRAGPYEAGAEIAEGGTATVYDAVGPRGAVVLKVLRRALSDDPRWVKRFERELDTLSRLAHPNIVTVLDHGRTDDGRPYLVLPRLRGRTLRAVLDERGALAPPEAWSVARPIAEALAAAHEVGVIHRDVKPDNVFLEGDGARESPRLIDFGMARDITDEARVTATGAPVGTPAYMAPEQWWNDGVGPASDQYAFATMLYELLAARTPHRSESFAALAQAHMSAEAPSLASAGVTASPAVESLVSRALTKDPSSRFASMRALIDAADVAFEVRDAASKRPPRAWAWPWPLAATLSALLVGYAGSHDPRQWLYISGWGGHAATLAFVALSFVAARRAMHPALALAPAALATFSTFTGWQATLAAVERVDGGARLAVYQEGLYEANAARGIGYLVATGLVAASLAPREARVGAMRLARASHIVASIALVTSLASIALGGSVVAIVPGACAALHVASSAPRGTRADELTAAIARVVGALLAWASAATLLDARVASSWGESITRAARVAEVLRTAREADALAVAGVAMVLLTAGVGAWRAASVPSTSWRPTRAGATLAMIAAAGCAVDLTFLAQMRSRRAALWSALAPAFELGARLSPPVAVGLPRPPLGPSLQLTVDRVAIDGTPVALTRALDTLEGQRVLAADLSHRLARGGATEAAELIVAVDASVPWRAV